MAGNIKGITIEFRGDTSQLDKALRQIDSETRSLNKELKQVDNALKFNPTNVELWRQKQELLTQKVDQTRERLDLLKKAQADMESAGVDKSSEQYRTLQREIITTENKAKNFETQLRQIGNVNLKATSEQFKQIGSSLESAGQAMKGVSIAAAAVVGSLGVASVKAGKAADEINTLSKVSGIGTENLQKYSYASDLVDVSVETLAKSQTKLKKSMFSARDGGSSAEVFEKLGVAVTDVNGNLRDSGDVFDEVIKSLGSMDNETERDALAMQLLGKSATELNPIIEDGGKTYQQVADTLSKYDLDYIDQETLDKANQFNDELDTMKLLGSVAFAQVGSQLAAYMAPALEKVVDLVGKLAGWLADLDPRVLAIIGGIASAVAVMAPLLIGLGKLATGISSIINLVNLIGPAIGALSIGPLAGIVLAIGAVVAAGILLYKNWDKIKAAAGQIKEKITSAWSTIKTATQNAWKSITDSITKPFKKAKDTISNLVSTIKRWFPINLGNLFKGIKLPHFEIEWSSFGWGDVTIDYPSGFDINWYKTGGIFNSPSLIGVGEAGAEAVVPLDQFWDKLDNMQTGEITINVYPSAGMNETELARKVEQALARVQKQRNLANGTI